MIDTGSVEELDGVLRSEERLVVVLFWTPWCEPCRELRPRLEELAAAREDVCVVAAVDATRQPELAARHGVSEYPTLVFFKRGQELRRLRAGALPDSTLELLGR